jgi:23S rRNA maturation-related 3'-5' exoribonuclease YhaM
MDLHHILAFNPENNINQYTQADLNAHSTIDTAAINPVMTNNGFLQSRHTMLQLPIPSKHAMLECVSRNLV